MSYSLPASAATVSSRAMKDAKARLGKLRSKLDDCEVGGYCHCSPRRPPAEFKLNDRRFAVAQTWVSCGFRAVPIIESFE